MKPNVKIILYICSNRSVAHVGREHLVSKTGFLKLPVAPHCERLHLLIFSLIGVCSTRFGEQRKSCVFPLLKQTSPHQISVRLRIL